MPNPSGPFFSGLNPSLSLHLVQSTFSSTQPPKLQFFVLIPLISLPLNYTTPQNVLPNGPACPGMPSPCLFSRSPPSFSGATLTECQTLLRSASVAPFGRSIPARCMLLPSKSPSRMRAHFPEYIVGELVAKTSITSLRQCSVRHLQAHQIWWKIHRHPHSRYAQATGPSTEGVPSGVEAIGY